MAASGGRPRVSRRREVSHTSARSLLMTILGEFVLPREEAVWTTSLVEVLAMFGVEEKSARQALARAAAEGWLVSEHVGRRARWSLTAPGRRLLTEGAERIYRFGRDRGTWDGRWLVLLISVPESQRDLRHRVRTRLNWAGFGSPAPGVWVSPSTARQKEAQAILSELAVASPMSFVASYGEIGDENTVVSRAWNLAELEGRYERFIAQFTRLEPVDGPAVLRAQTRLVHEWRRFPFLDPQLPVRLLPGDWSGITAADLFHGKHGQWHEDAQAQWDAVVARGGT